MNRVVLVLVTAAIAAVSAAPAWARQVRAGAAVLDGTYHVGNSAGQYSSTRDGGYGNVDPHVQQVKNQASYGVEARESVRALVIEGDGNYVALALERPLHPAGRALAAHRPAARRADGRRDQREQPDALGHAQPLVALVLVLRLGRVGVPGRLRLPLLRLLREAERRGRHEGAGRHARRARQRHGQLLRQVPQEPDGPRLGRQRDAGRLPAPAHRPRPDGRQHREHRQPGQPEAAREHREHGPAPGGPRRATT